MPVPLVWAAASDRESRGIRQQRWSPMPVPLVWAAASDRESEIVLQRLGEMASRIQQPVSFHGGECSASEIVSWDSTHSVT